VTKRYGVMALSDLELERYARHIVLREIGGPGQQRLKGAHVLVVGAGGLGAPALVYLAAAGVGSLTIIDDDTVDLSNLQRQVIHATGQVGNAKTISSVEAISRINPHVKVETVEDRFDRENGMYLVSGMDVVLDGSDNFATRYAVSDVCFDAGVPLVTGAVGRFDGQVTTLMPYICSSDGTPNPTYRCLFPNPPPKETVPVCAEAGILGVVPGIVGTIMAAEALKVILDLGDLLVGRLLLIDVLTMRFDEISYRWNPENPLTGSSL
jgi:molybdopterin/thiamine biosynthesis adenylyltransferase